MRRSAPTEISCLTSPLSRVSTDPSPARCASPGRAAGRQPARPGRAPCQEAAGRKLPAGPALADRRGAPAASRLRLDRRARPIELGLEPGERLVGIAQPLAQDLHEAPQQLDGQDWV